MERDMSFGMTEAQKVSFDRFLDEIESDDRKRTYNSRLYKRLEKRNEDRRRRKKAQGTAEAKD